MDDDECKRDTVKRITLEMVSVGDAEVVKYRKEAPERKMMSCKYRMVGGVVIEEETP